MTDHINDLTAEEITWRELFPDGRTICYEGDDAQAFVREITDAFGFDPSTDPAWLTTWLNGDPQWDDPFARTHWFHCPPEHLDAIYGSDRWPMGS